MLNRSTTKNKKPIIVMNWLFVFVFFYPLILFPGQLFYKPTIIDETLKLFVVENYLLLPKILFLMVFSIYGFLTTRKYWCFDAFTTFLSVNFFIVILSSINSKDDIAFIILGGQKRLDGLLYQTSLHIFAISIYSYVKSFSVKLQQFYLVLLSSAIIQSFLVFLQISDIDFIGKLTYIEPIKIPAGTMTHPGFLIGWLLPVFILGVSVHSKLPKIFLYAHAFSLILVLSAILFSSNRTALYTIAVLLLILIFFNKSKRIFSLCIGFFVLFVSQFFLILSLPSITLDALNTRTLETRIQIWRLFSLQVGKIPYMPFIGGGGDAFRLSLLRDPPVDEYIKFDAMESGWQNYDIEKAQFILEEPSRLSEIEIHFAYLGDKKNAVIRRSIDLDRVHNFLFDRIISYGGISALIWVVLYFYPLVMCFLKFKKNKNSVQLSLILVILSVIFYYTIWFPFLLSEPLHLIFIAIAWVYSNDKSVGLYGTNGELSKSVS
jgi:hypothetical protein